MRTGTARSSPRACLVRRAAASAAAAEQKHARAREGGGRCSVPACCIYADACTCTAMPTAHRGAEAHLWPAILAQGHRVCDATGRGRQVDRRRPAGLRPLVFLVGAAKSWRSARRRGSIICSSRPAAPLPRRVVTADSTRAVRSSAQLQGLCAWPGCPSEVHRRARSQTADTRVACMRSFAILTCRLHYCEPKPYTLNHARRATQPRPTGCTTLRLRQACALS